MSYTPNTIKHIVGKNHYGNRIQMIDNSNAILARPVCDENEGWHHVASCEKNNDIREEWAKELEKKIRKVHQHKNA